MPHVALKRSLRGPRDLGIKIAPTLINNLRQQQLIVTVEARYEVLEASVPSSNQLQPVALAQPPLPSNHPATDRLCKQRHLVL